MRKQLSILDLLTKNLTCKADLIVVLIQFKGIINKLQWSPEIQILKINLSLVVRRLESNSTLESYETIYLNAWQRQVETTGYFQISQKDILQGNFKVQIRSIIDSMGNLIGADILKSSGNSSMDALALKILQQAAPFEPFPVDMAANYQQLEIIRDWNFTNS